VGRVRGRRPQELQRQRGQPRRRTRGAGGARGRERRRKERGRPRDHGPDPKARACQWRARRLRRRRPRRRARGLAQSHSRQEGRPHPAGRLARAQPGSARRSAARRDDATPPQGFTRRGDGTGARRPGTRRPRRSRARPERVSERAQRRDEATRGDRDGALVRARAAHRRRSHLGGRRHDPGADPEGVQGPHGDAGRRGAVHHPRSPDRLHDVLARRRALRGPRRRDRPRREILSRPQHPYTQALLACSPTVDRRASPLPVVPGAVPDVFETITGCRFHPRCPRRLDRCPLDEPRLVGDGHRVACWNPVR
jgi:oligopeptide/dipeptide ABC transporter ATP-binding protein